MTQMAVAVMPIADPDAWQAFAEEIWRGARSDDHRAFLRRGGIRKETLFHQQTPMGDLMVLVWDGVDPTPTRWPRTSPACCRTPPVTTSGTCATT